MMVPNHARLVGIVVVLGFALIEYAVGRATGRDTYDLPESAASFGVAIGRHLFALIEGGLLLIPFSYVYAHRLFAFGSTTPLALLGAFVGTELLYYWHHRISHRLRWFWATHSVHHSTTRFNLSAAIRLGWAGNLTGSFVFFLPLVWLGFSPMVVLAMLAANLFYQFFLHTELVDRLGILEHVLNTPAHHRVHHASNAVCIDRNFGGVLIVFDRLFGTFAVAPENEPLRYGLVGGAQTQNPVRIALAEWIAMFHDALHARGLAQRARALFSVPRASMKEPPALGDGATRDHARGNAI